MKSKEDFVTNSSSTSFIITNKTKNKKTLVDFVKENPHLIEQFVKEYDYHETNYNQEELLKSAKENNKIIHSGVNQMVFGDEQRTLIGHVFDYILRDGGESESFKWQFDEYYR